MKFAGRTPSEGRMESRSTIAMGVKGYLIKAPTPRSPRLMSCVIHRMR